METITIIPNSKRQAKIIKALLEEMKVRFVTYTDEPEVSEAAMESINRGIEAADNGDFLSEEEAKKMFHDAIYKVD